MNRHLPDIIVAIALAVGVGVAVRPSIPGAAAVVALAALAAVYRRQESVDRANALAADDRERLQLVEEKLESVQKDLEPMKLDYERRKLQGR